MPNRILREGILTSQRVDQLSEGAELFYRRLHSRLDDHGRHEAHPELLRTACYPLRVDRVKARHIAAWLEECVRARLLVVYEAVGKRYLQALDWRQQVRADSKCPAPDAQMLSKCCADDARALSNAHLVGGVVGGVVGGGGEGERKAPADASSAVALSAAASPSVNGNAVAHIPLNDGTEYGISPDYAAELGKLYPAVDIPQTLNEIRGWNLAHPAKRKTRRGVIAHINTWMQKEQNRG